MAEIFKAKTSGAHGFEKTIAVKRIIPRLADDELVRLFIGEARAMMRLTHPKIVQVIDFGQLDGSYFMAMEYVAGMDLLALLRRCAKLRVRPTTSVAVHIVAEVLDALDYAHTLKDEQGQSLEIVHSDVSPSNVFVSRHGEVKLGDFGIAQAGAALGISGRGLRGKYGYMSPEQVSGRPVDGRADVFAAGIVLAELLMVRRLFMADKDVEVLLQVRDARLDRLDQFGSQIPPELRVILESALARDREMRYQSAAAFRDALHRHLFDNRRMVRSVDIQSFLLRLETKEVTTGPRLPVVTKETAPRRIADVLSVGAVGRKRKIQLTPPPLAEPLPDTGEQPPVSTDEAHAAAGELGSTGAEFRSLYTEDESLPDVDELQTPVEPARVAVSRRITPMGGVSIDDLPDITGTLDERSLFALFFNLAAEEETGLLVLSQADVRKEVFLVDGDPQYVDSNREDELFGQYLVAKGVLGDGELSMALAMMPHYQGRLGETLVALKLLRPVAVLRLLTAQVREKLLEVFRWRSGRFAFYRGKRTARDSAPLGLDAFELLGAAVKSLPVAEIEERIAGLRSMTLRAVEHAPIPPEVFRLGGRPRRLYDQLRESRRFSDVDALVDNEEARAEFVQMTYLLLECGLVTAAESGG